MGGDGAVSAPIGIRKTPVHRGLSDGRFANRVTVGGLFDLGDGQIEGPGEFGGGGLSFDDVHDRGPCGVRSCV